MEVSEAMGLAENASNEFEDFHDKLDELKTRFEDVWAAIDSHRNYKPEHEIKYKQGSWDLACALDALRGAADLMNEAYDLLNEG